MHLPRRTLAVTCALTVTLSIAAAAQAGTHHPSRFVTDFTTARSDYSAMFRWWWPSSVDATTAVNQLHQVAAAGYKGVEIAMVMDGTNYVVDPDKHQYGDANWRAAVRAVLAEGQKLGVQIDLTLGSRWPAAVPGLDVSTDAASQELVTGSAVVAARTTFTAAVPAPAARTYQDRTSANGVVTTTIKTSKPTYVTATATRCVAACAENQPQVDLTTVTDISGRVRDGQVNWTAPGDGTWIVTGYWKRGTAQRNDAPFGSTVSPLSDPESRVVNHLDTAGTKAFIAYFDRLLDADTRRLLKANGGSIFEDSLELSGAQLWSSDFLRTFRETNGFSLATYLPVLAKTAPASPFASPTPVYTYAGGQAANAGRIQHDIEATINELYLNNHLEPIKAWANRLGLTFRAQPYGEPIDLGDAAKRLDITECESLGCSEARMRTASTSAVVAGKTVVSSEMLPGGFGNLYGLTPAQIAALANREYSRGINQMIFHGLPYPTMPPSADGAITDNAAYWPGFHGFGSNIGEAFGPRQATWTMEPELADYYARMQQTLQTGQARYDVAVLNQTFGGDTPTHDGSFLATAGYTYGYVTPGSLSGKTPYRALIVDSSPMSLETARALARKTQDGLQLIIIGAGPQHTIGYAQTAAAAASDDSALRSVFAKLRKSANVRTATDNADVLTKLAVRPDAQIADTSVTSTLRTDGDTSYYVLVNSGTAAVSTSVSLAGRTGAVPYRLDAWTGKIEAVGGATRSGNRTTLTVSLPAGAATIIALAGPTWTGKRITAPKLTTGAPVTLGSWDLTLDEWLPGTSTDSSSTTVHRTHEISDVALRSWSEIPGIEDAVGIGSYTTTVISRGGKALLNVGAVGGSYQVFVNGRQVEPADQLDTVIDLGGALRPGANTVTVTVASVLLNRLRITRPAEFAGRTPTKNGLLGTVTLTPYH
ncbi:glycosyl hydrolase [Actinoplanes sp. CA-015351]|uniref:glycosyl hydrolase n=1 Tax=Actinoplanes sp. CA-015351 TaxID=3239897 RepID=UPI003D97A1CD